MVPFFLVLTMTCSVKVRAEGFSTIKSFGILTDVTGFSPSSHLVQGADGTLYGTTEDGEGHLRGTLFKVQPDGSGFAVLRFFTNQSQFQLPQRPGGLILNGSVLYGITVGGGASGFGTVFRVNTNGTGYAELKSFTGDEGRYPDKLVLHDDKLYGTTTEALLGGPGATINSSSGVLTWRPDLTQANGTYPVTLTVTDSGTPGQSATNHFNLVVNALTQPSMASAIVHGLVTLTVSGQAGPDYAVQACTDLSGGNWLSILRTNSPPMPFSFTDLGSAVAPFQFYRVVAGPPLP